MIEFYLKSLESGINILTNPELILDIQDRVLIQNWLFKRGSVPENNERFYRYCWEYKPHFCEESTAPLYHYSAKQVSHIMTKGAHVEMAFDIRNINLLTFKMHNKWEFGDKSVREQMRIYTFNEYIINLLKHEYCRV